MPRVGRCDQQRRLRLRGHDPGVQPGRPGADKAAGPGIWIAAGQRPARRRRRPVGVWRLTGPLDPVACVAGPGRFWVAVIRRFREARATRKGWPIPSTMRSSSGRRGRAGCGSSRRTRGRPFRPQRRSMRSRMSSAAGSARPSSAPGARRALWARHRLVSRGGPPRCPDGGRRPRSAGDRRRRVLPLPARRQGLLGRPCRSRVERRQSSTRSRTIRSASIVTFSALRPAQCSR